MEPTTTGRGGGDASSFCFFSTTAFSSCFLFNRNFDCGEANGEVIGVPAALFCLGRVVRPPFVAEADGPACFSLLPKKNYHVQ
jgi:hypothetical protein